MIVRAKGDFKESPAFAGLIVFGVAHVIETLFGFDVKGLAVVAIEPDERLNWHLYLKELGDSGKFFTDLEKN